MQQFKEELKNVPRNALLVSCSTNSQLNKEEILSVENKVLSLNNPEVDQSVVQQQRQDLRVPVLNIRGIPLMPTSCRKAKKFLKEGKAKVIKRIPFTIQLTIPTGETKQAITLGIDSGYQNIGFSAITEKQELISGVVTLDNGMTKRLEERKIYRRHRRNKLWYRKPRFLNRVSSKKEGWLPPSILRRFKTHVFLIEKIKKLLPISKIRIEVAKFDIQKIENPLISGKDYQQGTLYEYRNRIAYLIAREKGKCQYCNKEYQKNNGWRLHHIWGKTKDRPADWALLHKSCHSILHDRKEEHILQKQKSKSYKDSAFMNLVRWKFKKEVDCDITYGNITFQNRINLGLDKSHNNDAFVIAQGHRQIRSIQYNIEQKHSVSFP